MPLPTDIGQELMDLSYIGQEVLGLRIFDSHEVPFQADCLPKVPVFKEFGKDIPELMDFWQTCSNLSDSFLNRKGKG